MTVIYTATIGGYDYGFDFADQRIDIDAALSSVVVGDLWDAIQEAQADVVGMPYSQIATAEGLTTISTGITTYLTVTLLDSWELNTLLSSGKFQVAGGNLVRDDEADPFRDNPLITYINNLSQAGVVAETGISGLTPEESTNLAAIKTKTDELTFTESGNVDANVQYVNDVEVDGTGATGDEWGPA